VNIWYYSKDLQKSQGFLQKKLNLKRDKHKFTQNLFLLQRLTKMPSKLNARRKFRRAFVIL